MNISKKSVKKISLGIIILLIVSTLGFSWYVAGLLVNKPLSERPQFCMVPARTCVIRLLKKFHMEDEKIVVELTSFDGTKLRGLYFPSKNNAAVIVQHGYGGHMGSVMHIAHMLHEQGYGVITMDLRAHGSSGGEQVTFGKNEARDMQYVFDYLKNRKEVNADKIGLYGWSLGGATVLLHGDHNKEVKSVIADSPFDAINYENMQQFTDTPWPFPALFRFFSSIRSDTDFDKNAPINNLDAYQNKPLFLMIAGSDQVVDPQSGERLLKKLNNSTLQIWREPTFGHIRFSFDAKNKFSRKVLRFFNTTLSPSPLKTGSSYEQ